MHSFLVLSERHIINTETYNDGLKIETKKKNSITYLTLAVENMGNASIKK